MKVGFYNPELCYRGSTRAILSYCKALIDINSDIELTYFFHKNSRRHNVAIGLKFLELGVKLSPIKNSASLIKLSDELSLMYVISSAPPGALNWLSSLSCKTLLHQNGYQSPDFLSSTYFAYVSYWQSACLGSKDTDVLPHIVEEPAAGFNKTDIRTKLGIPKDSIVLGRHGGADTWNLEFVTKEVIEAAQNRSDLYFLFMGTPVFSNLKNIIFLDGTSYDEEIEKFISACDAMIHARWEGETFGIACAEFMIRGKPIITWSGSRELNHALMSENSATIYNTAADLRVLLHSISHEYIRYKAEMIPMAHLKEKYSRTSVGKLFLDYVVT